MPVKNNSNEISFTRVYEAPVKAVWEAWTDPKKVAKWWGPRGFTITTHGKDLRPGGFWSYTMHGPDGTDYVNKTIYHEVEKYKKLVYDHGGGDDRPPLFRVTVLFSENKGKTRMDMTMSFATPEVAKEMAFFIQKARGYSTWDRLGEYLDFESTGREKFMINRSFNAPIEAVYDMWKNPEHFSKWLAPAGFEHLEMNRPHRIVYKQQFTDENENLSRHPGLAAWPPTMLTTVTFVAEGSDQTRVTVLWEPTSDATPEEIDAFVQMRTSMTEGWTGSFDKLDNYLAEEEG